MMRVLQHAAVEMMVTRIPFSLCNVRMEQTQY